MESNIPSANIEYNLLAQVAHEVRSPFNGLIGFSDLLHSNYELLSEDKKIAYIKLINQLTQKSFNQVQILISWIKLISNNLHLNYSQTSLKETLQSAVRFNITDVETKNILIDDSCKESNQITADYIQLAVALSCVLFTATRHIDENKTIGISDAVSGNNLLIIFQWSLSESSSKIEDPLHLKDIDTVYNEGNYRLWIAKKILELHGGSLNTEQNQDQLSILVKVPQTPQYR